MLEKAAEALALELGADWEMAPPSVRAKWIEGARAVLLAVRDPSDPVLDEGARGSLEDSTTVALGAWHAMIDAITKE